jgi:hypothetical protein
MNESACVPGGVIACPCAEGPSGTQECAADGTRYAPCVCAGASDTTEPPPNDANGDCITHFKKACTEDSVYWYDSCGNKEDLVETCPEEFSCAQGACNDPCVPQSVQKCVEDAVYWFDSCDNKQTVALQCTDEQFCQQNSCVEASFSGTWEVTANPDEQALPGFWTASYAPRKLVITVDGDTVTAAVLNENTVYTGTREGKTATLEASYVESGSAGAPATTHASKLTLTLASPGLFLGMDIDTMSADMGQGPTTLGKMIWNITGLFQ